jgi:hypothetical protein
MDSFLVLDLAVCILVVNATKGWNWWKSHSITYSPPQRKDTILTYNGKSVNAFQDITHVLWIMQDGEIHCVVKFQGVKMLKQVVYI